jgi:hypothetical protein
MSNKTIYNWKPVVGSFIRIAQHHGLVLQGVDNGDGIVKTLSSANAIDEATACDEACVYFTAPDGKRVVAYLVLGNDPDETVCDYSMHPLMDAATEQFSKKWEGKKVPTRIVE